MKKLVLVLALMVAFSMSAFAAGKFYVGGTLGFVSESDTYDGKDAGSSSVFSITPEVGYVINEKLDVGLDFGYLMRSKKDASGDTVDYSGFGIAPYVRYALAEAGDLRFLAKFAIGYESVKADVDDAEAENTISFSLAPVVEYKLTESFALVATADFLSLSFYSCDKNKSTTFGFNGGLGGSLGVSFSF
ncbi:MAG: porin family protein [Endomicrobia bacterium]|nr:porin family protein [Endomicrobiia bacterium]